MQLKNQMGFVTTRFKLLPELTVRRWYLRRESCTSIDVDRKGRLLGCGGEPWESISVRTEADAVQPAR